MSQIIQAVKYKTCLQIYLVNLNGLILNNESNSNCNL